MFKSENLIERITTILNYIKILNFNVLDTMADGKFHSSLYLLHLWILFAIELLIFLSQNKNKLNKLEKNKVI